MLLCSIDRINCINYFSRAYQIGKPFLFLACFISSFMKLKIAIQKSGRLYDDSLKMLRDCGIELTNGVNKLRTDACNFPLEILFLRDDDIPQYVADRVADVGIVGENVLLEKQASVQLVQRLGFARCRLSIAVPRGEDYDSVAFLQSKKIATSYPVLLQQFLDQQNVQAEIHEISGSVEIAPGIGLADAICDLVSSGSTLFLNGLKEAETILRSEAVLISNPAIEAEKLEILDSLLFRINAVKKAKRSKYILLNAPNNQVDAICNLIPGMKSPTVLPLAIEGWSSLHSVVNEDEFWSVTENLKALGAQGILVIPIEKMIV